MFEKLKAVFKRSASTPDLPARVWVVTVLLNPYGSKQLTPAEMVEFARRNADDIGERAHTLYFDGTSAGQNIELFTQQASALRFISRLAENRVMRGDKSNITAFGLVLLPREQINAHIESAPNLRIILDAGLPTERDVPRSEIERYAKS